MRRVVPIVAAVVLAVIAVTGAIRAFGGDEGGAPPDDASQLMPDSTLVYVSLSTDGEREATSRAADIAGRFDAYERLRDQLLQRLAGARNKVDVAKDVAPWVGDEASFALVDSGQSTAGSLIAIEVTDTDLARKFLERNPREGVRKTYKEHETTRYGTVTTAFVGDFLMIGQDPTVQAAIDREQSDVPSLADSKLFDRALQDLPDERVATAYASADGLRRLLLPAGDLLGGIATVVDQPGLEAVAIAAAAQEDDKVRLVVHSALQEEGRSPSVQFEPELLETIPAGVLGYLGTSGVSGALERLLVSSLGGDVAPVLERLRTQLEKETEGGDLQKDLFDLFKGEVALVVQQQIPAPILSLITKTEDEAGTRRVLDGLRDPLARLLRPEGEPEPEWKAVDIAGTDGWTLTLPNGSQVTYAVAESHLILSTSPEGIRSIVGADETLEDADRYEEVLSGRPDSVGTLGFLDFSQLLELGEQTGLNDSRTYIAARDDLRKIRAIGVSSSSSEGESTAEILVSIP